MKTQNETASSKEINSHINKKHLTHYHTATAKGTNQGISKQPALDEALLHPLVADIHSSYDTLLAEVIGMLNPKLLIQLGAVQKQSSEKEATNTKKRSAQLQSENELRKREYENRSWVWPIIAFTGAVLFCVGMIAGEWHYLSDALQVIVSDYRSCLIISFGISAALVAVSHFLDPFLKKKIESPQTRKIIMWVAVLLIIGMFMFLGFLRSKYLKLLHNIDTSPWLYILITVTLFAGLMLASDQLLKPAYKEVKEAFTILINQWRIWVTKRKIKRLEKKAVEIEKGNDENLENKLITIADAKNYETLVGKLYQETVNAYKTANIAAREDGIPNCFSQDVPPLSTYTDDINI